MIGLLVGAAGTYFIMTSTGEPTKELTSIKLQRDSALTVIDSLKKEDSLKATYIHDLEEWADFALDTVKENENEKKNISAITALPSDSNIGLLRSNLSKAGSN